MAKSLQFFFRQYPSGHGRLLPEQKPYGVKCSCRKPETGLITRAMIKYEIDVNESYMVGDRASDILTGQIKRYCLIVAMGWK